MFKQIKYLVSSYTFFFPENPFTCDCEIAWFRDWVTIRNTTVVNLPMETRCNEPPHLKDMAIPSVTHSQLGCVSRATEKTVPLNILLILLFVGIFA